MCLKTCLREERAHCHFRSTSIIILGLHPVPRDRRPWDHSYWSGLGLWKVGSWDSHIWENCLWHCVSLFILTLKQQECSTIWDYTCVSYFAYTVGGTTISGLRGMHNNTNNKKHVFNIESLFYVMSEMVTGWRFLNTFFRLRPLLILWGRNIKTCSICV